MSEVSSEEDRSASGSDVDELSDAEDIHEADSDQTDASDEEGNHGYFDLEAAESDDDIGDGVSTEYGDGEVYFFPQFSRLPIELRTRIWEIFDPDMRKPARVFDFIIPKGRQLDAWESPTLEGQTAPARAVLATHRESRSLALRYYPDEALFRQGRGLVRCKKATDIILLHGYDPSYSDIDWTSQIVLLNGVKNLALGFIFDSDPRFEIHPLADVNSGSYPIFQCLPDLCTLYCCQDASSKPGHSLRWCASDSARSFYVQNEEEVPGLGEDVEYVYCWRDPTVDQASDENGALGEPTFGHNDSVYQLDGGQEVWPMVQFGFEKGIRRYEKICSACSANGEWDDNYSSSEESSVSNSEENEYESEGIDDDTIDGSQASSDDGDDIVLDQTSQREDASTFGGSSPRDGEMVGPFDHAVVGANFSSLEPESPSMHNADDSTDEDKAARKSQRPKRRVVTDSEDESGGSEVQKDIRPAGRHTRPILSDSGDDSDKVQKDVRPAGRRARVVLSDSEDEEEEDDNADEAGLKAKGTVISLGDKVDSTEESEPENGEDESSTTEPESTKLTLAERLSLFRSENPVADPESDSDPGADDDGVPHDYTDFPDDENGEDQSENDDALDMAEDEFDDREEEEW